MKLILAWIKKNVIIVAAVAAVVVAAIILTLVLTLGNSASKMKQMYDNSVDGVVSVEKVAEIKDGEFTAAEKTEKITFVSGDEAEIVTTSKKLNEFKMETEETSSTEKGVIDRASLVAVNLDKSLFEKGYSFRGNTFKGKVSAQNARRFFPDATLSVDGNINVEVAFKSGRVSTINCYYTTGKGLAASLKITYSYGD